MAGNLEDGSLLTSCTACWIPLVGTESDGMGLHAGPDRLRGLAEMAGFCGRLAVVVVQPSLQPNC